MWGCVGAKGRCGNCRGRREGAWTEVIIVDIERNGEIEAILTGKVNKTLGYFTDKINRLCLNKKSQTT